MTKKMASGLKGRPVRDVNGNQTWQWDADVDVDTGLVRTLGEGITLDEANAAGAAKDSNPYEQTVTVSESLVKRRTLDDMRALSDKIKRTKHWTPGS